MRRRINLLLIVCWIAFATGGVEAAHVRLSHRHGAAEIQASGMQRRGFGFIACGDEDHCQDDCIVCKVIHAPLSHQTAPLFSIACREVGLNYLIESQQRQAPAPGAADCRGPPDPAV